MRCRITCLVLVVTAMLAADRSGARDAPDLPSLEAFTLYQQFVEGTASADADFDTILDGDPEPSLRLDIARALVETGDAQRAIDLLLALIGTLPEADARRTQAFDLLARAHAVRGDYPEAFDAGIMAYDAAVARLGPDNPLLLRRLDALIELARRHDLPDQDLIADERAALQERVDTPVRTRQLGKPVAVPVWFGTNRVDLGDPDPAGRFGAARSDLTVGRLLVTIPPGHRFGVIETPSTWGFTRHWDPMRHIVLADLETLSDAVFSSGCCAAEDRLMFIHGYNVGFHDGALRAAQLAFDLGFPGQAMYFSWPSRGTLLGYLADANNVLPSRPELARFLELATRGTGRLHIIAHSMGNRYLLEALDIFLRDYPDRRLGQIVLGAPDVDRSELVVRLEVLRDRAEGITLYASRNDRALLVSRKIHGAPRAGDSSGDPLRVSGLATLDASEIEADLLGHSYFGDSPLVLGDLAGLIRLGLEPDNRCGTRERLAPVWDLRPDGCPVDQVVAAGALLAQHGEATLAKLDALQAEATGDDLDFWVGVMAIVDALLAPGHAPRQ